ncbi:hypothetical protein A5685_02640 [Mycobacterium colombiense]|uniref:Uncharacterized protein n=1 Tax=Mycobacterium colombiense TaxID=339268 RepID=A0A1A2SDB6_9MYCO|nr:hypothetical protein [Mycobacterium colombiense]OBH62169.1 hypothetical protein A5685_02640 [Mycobacterium colombiense]
MARDAPDEDLADLQIGEGRLAADLRSLKPIATVQLDVTTEGQLALHMPAPSSVPGRTEKPTLRG